MPLSLRKILDRVMQFRTEADGAVTVDFVVLCAGVVTIAIFIMSPFGLAPLQLGDETNERMVEARETIFGDDFISIRGQ